MPISVKFPLRILLRCVGEFIQARSTSDESEKSMARFSPACSYSYPSSWNQCHGSVPFGDTWAKYPLIAMSFAFACATATRIGLIASSSRPPSTRSPFARSTRIADTTAATSEERSAVFWKPDAKKSPTITTENRRNVAPPSISTRRRSSFNPPFFGASDEACQNV